MSGKYHFSIDRGGTFTDCIAEYPDGHIEVVKLLSEDEGYTDAATEAIRRVLSRHGPEIPRGTAIPTEQLGSVRVGTTVATNALLERHGRRTALVITAGLEDVLRIGTQARPKLFDLSMARPPPLYEAVVSAYERVLPSATSAAMAEHTPLDETRLAADLTALRAQTGIDSVAIVLAHAHEHSAHECQAGRVAERCGFAQVSLSSEVMPMARLVPRGWTTVADAYLTPVLADYVARFERNFDRHLHAHCRLYFMRSDGGLCRRDAFRGASAVLSGPAGGVVGYARSAYKDAPVVGFDMGGTSTDVSRFDGQWELEYESCVAGVPLQSPQLAIHTVAAGGGSLLTYEHGLFRVGPDSAGAMPGPVCYGRGGTKLTLTDANVLLGRVQAHRFPAIFGPNEDQPLDVDAARRAFEALAAEIAAAEHRHKTGEAQSECARTAEEVALGFVRVANAAMARPIRSLTEAKGHPPARHVLASFGGAGGQHACDLARLLGMRRVFVHRHAGVLSAVGIGLADLRIERSEPSRLLLKDADWTDLQSIEHRLEEEVRRAALAEEKEKDASFSEDASMIDDLGLESRLSFERYVDLRYEGTDSLLRVARVGSASEVRAVLEARYRREFGFVLPEDRPVCIENVRVLAVIKTRTWTEEHLPAASDPTPVPAEHVDIWFEPTEPGGQPKVHPCPLFETTRLLAGHTIEGPAILIQPTSTVILPPFSVAHVDSLGHLLIDLVDLPMHPKARDSESNALPSLTPAATKGGPVPGDEEIDPILLSVMANRFMGIAEQMGQTLQRTAISTNIKERLDFSCALFSRDGHLVANAPHLPVHLGSMSEAVRHQLRRLGDRWQEGDVLVSNHPQAGGSHLPDITVMTPVYAGEPRRPVFFVASRGHHADIGGLTPGSMPPFSTRLAEEGAAIHSFRLVHEGRFDETGISQLLLHPDEISVDSDGCFSIWTPTSNSTPSSSSSSSRVAGTRTLSHNLADLRAQVSANQKGIVLLHELMAEHGVDTVLAYMQHIQTHAEACVRDTLRRLGTTLAAEGRCEVLSDGRVRVAAHDQMDDGAPLCVEVTLDLTAGSAVVDFAGSSMEVAGNLNAPRAVTTSAVLYVLRCLVDRDIPLNEGCLAPISLNVPTPSILAPSAAAAVVGGNVLTSQRVTDVLLTAFQACACSQGCMNNVTFGCDSFGYYETIAGGGGAGPGWHGESAVHSHMTNTRITDVEILESRYPVFLRTFAVRKSSGGRGLFHGGDGVVRELEFLAPLLVGVLSERRAVPPPGLRGGLPGLRGRNTLYIAAEQRWVSLGGKASFSVRPGDILRIETPGAGGYGLSLDESSG